MNTQPKRDVVFVASDKQLLSESYYRRLWMAVKNIGIPRRAWLDEIADTIRDYQGSIVTYSGTSYEIPFIDDVFGDDPDMRWLSYFMVADRTGKLPKAKTRKLERLRMIDLYFRIRYPAIADHFKR